MAERGKIARLFPDRGYGFVQPDCGDETLFFHSRHVLGRDARFVEMRVGDAVLFDVREDGDGRVRADAVTRVG